MKRQLVTTLNTWLRLELRGGGQEAAERLLGELWLALREPAPAAGFVDRVLLAAGLDPSPAVRPTAAQWVARLAIATCLVVAGLGLLVVVPALAALVRLVRLDALVHGGVELLIAGLAWLVRGLAFWDVLADVGRAVGLAASTPQAAASLAGATLIAGLALLMLISLTRDERGFAHVDRARF